MSSYDPSVEQKKENIGEISLDDLTLEEKVERSGKSFLKQLPYLTLMDDYYFMLYAQQYPEDFSMIVGAFLDKDIKINIDTFKIQTVYVTPDDSKDVRFDMTAKTYNDENVVLEVESRKKFSELRLRYYISKIDSMLLPKGEKYDKLPPVYMIIVNRHDIGEENKPKYIMRTCIVESPTEVGNNVRIVDDKRICVYVNANYEKENDNSLLAKIIHDFTCDNPNDMQVDVLREHNAWLKGTEKGRATMEAAIKNTSRNHRAIIGRLLSDEERLEARSEGRMEGRMEGEQSMLQKLIDAGAVSKKTVEKLFKGQEMPNVTFPSSV